MTEWQTPIVVAVLNTNDDLVELLRVALEQAGMIVVSAHIDDLRRGTLDLPNFLRQHDPRVVVYDVPPPYEAHWRFFEHLRQSPDLQGREFILTSTNVDRLYETVGTKEPIFELVGKPYDLERITRAVKEASRARPTGPVQMFGMTRDVSAQSEARDQSSARPSRARTQRSRQRNRRRSAKP
jgi:DNA-binding NtrC family response regulator